MARKTYTSNEVKMRWENKAYKKYMCRFRYDTDQELIDWISDHKDEMGISEMFRQGIQKLMEEYKED